MVTWITEYGKKNGNGRKCRTYKVKNFTELIDRLRKNNMKEAANSIFEMVAYADAMEKNGFGLRGTRDGKGPAS